MLSFYITSGPRSRVFVGLDNFIYLLQDNDFRRAFWNNCVIAFFSLALQLPLSLLLAVMLNRHFIHGRNLFRFGFFSPYVFGTVFVAILFNVIFIPQFGLLNRLIFFLTGEGLETKWLSNPRLVMPALIMTTLWLYVGLNMIYFLAALQTVDQELYDAARADGANVFQQFLHVTLPGIQPILVFVIIMSTIGSFQLFELPYILLNNTAGPDNAGLTLVMHMFIQGFNLGDLGHASAIGWTLALCIIMLSLVQVRIFGGLGGRH